jgi:hypothetical protein
MQRKFNVKMLIFSTNSSGNSGYPHKKMLKDLLNDTEKLKYTINLSVKV